jgi:hypothetical protein
MVARAAAALALLAGCYNYVTDSFQTNDFSGDEFPTYVDTTSAAILVGLQPDGEMPHDAVLDVLSPLTIIDRGPTAAPGIAYTGLTLLGEAGAGGPVGVPRAHFTNAQTVTLHPCNDDPCEVGAPAQAAPPAPLPAPPPASPFSALLGMSAFASDALRLHLDPAAPHIFILPDIAGDELHRSIACDAVLPAPFRGGGTLLLGGTEVPFTNWRIAIDTCLAPSPDLTKPYAANTMGTDVLLVMSTGIGISLLGESAYERYRQLVPSAPDVSALPTGSVLLPSGVVTGQLATIPGLALVGNLTGLDTRAPCHQVYVSHLMQTSNVSSVPDANGCPCGADPDATGKCRVFCNAPAIVELTPTAPGIEFLIVSDDEPTLQALRAELRPDRPEVDGLLGANALQTLEVDIDYPHDRLLGRCFPSTAGCVARPEITADNERACIQECLGLPVTTPCTL